MKSKFSILLVGILIGALLFGGIPALADLAVTQTTSKVLVDGVEKTVGAYNIDGSNYFKLRDFTAAVDIGVWFDGENNTIHIETDKGYDPNYTGGGTPAPPTEPTQATEPTAATAYSRTNPAPKGVSQTIRIDDFLETYTTEITLNEVIRGSDALKMVLDASLLNSNPAEGKEYIVANFTAKLIESKDDKSVSFSTYSFRPFSSGNAEYSDYSLVVAPDPKFSGELYASGTLTGYAVFTVDVSDSAPRVVYGRNYDGTGGIWFLLQS